MLGAGKRGVVEDAIRGNDITHSEHLNYENIT